MLVEQLRRSCRSRRRAPACCAAPAMSTASCGRLPPRVSAKPPLSDSIVSPSIGMRSRAFASSPSRGRLQPAYRRAEDAARPKREVDSTWPKTEAVRARDIARRVSGVRLQPDLVGLDRHRLRRTVACAASRRSARPRSEAPRAAPTGTAPLNRRLAHLNDHRRARLHERGDSRRVPVGEPHAAVRFGRGRCCPARACRAGRSVRGSARSTRRRPGCSGRP